MKVILLNGSPRQGNTRAALEECARALNDCGVETELIDIGLDVPGCRACGACSKLGRCVIDDGVNAFAEKMRSADGLIVGSPVYYASPTARSSPSWTGCSTATSASWPTSRPPPWPWPAGRAPSPASTCSTSTSPSPRCPLSAPPTGTTPSARPPASPPMTRRGCRPCATLARNMAWLLKCIELGRRGGVEPPESESGAVTNFIR